MSQLGGFSIDHMESFCSAQGIETTSAQGGYNISDAEIALQQSCFNQLWQVGYHFYTLFFCIKD